MSAFLINFQKVANRGCRGCRLWELRKRGLSVIYYYYYESESNDKSLYS